MHDFCYNKGCGQSDVTDGRRWFYFPKKKKALLLVYFILSWMCFETEFLDQIISCFFFPRVSSFPLLLLFKVEKGMPAAAVNKPPQMRIGIEHSTTMENRFSKEIQTP